MHGSHTACQRCGKDYGLVDICLLNWLAASVFFEISDVIAIYGSKLNQIGGQHAINWFKSGI
jgi:hypothetical protein